MSPFRRGLLGVAGLFVVGLLSVGCTSDGRDLAEPQDWQTTTTRPPPPTSALPSETGANGLALSSPEFEPGGMVPGDLLCTGANRAPALEWEGVPGTASELAVALIDQTEPENPLLLWLITGIGPSVTGLAAGEVPPGAVETLNDYGQPGWGNPCLEGLTTGLRDLQFKIYVLDVSSGIAQNAAGNEAWDTVAASAIDAASVLIRVEAQSP